MLLSAVILGGVLAHDAGWNAPSDAAARVNPLAGRTELAAGGKKVFSQRCAECHGADARGTDKAPDLTAPEVQAQPDGALFWKITSGNSRSGMPSFSNLTEPQRWQVVLYLRQGTTTTGARQNAAF
jgi:mono/diheme cytochrome c family protein